LGHFYIQQRSIALILPSLLNNCPPITGKHTTFFQPKIATPGTEDDLKESAQNMASSASPA
jgi:hypothetical protein